MNLKYKVRLRDTDATGVLYFTEQLRMALDALDDHFPLQNILKSNDLLLPIVHVEADYFSPLRVGDEVEISLNIEKIGTTSFSIGYLFLDPLTKKKVGFVKIVHVVTSRKEGTPLPIPGNILTFLTHLTHNRGDEQMNDFEKLIS